LKNTRCRPPAANLFPTPSSEIQPVFKSM
jgi:hypothetical protein